MSIWATLAFGIPLQDNEHKMWSEDEALQDLATSSANDNGLCFNNVGDLIDGVDFVYFVAPERLVFSADAGECCEVNATQQITKTEENRLRRFCEAVGIEYEEPRWFLMAGRG